MFRTSLLRRGNPARGLLLSALLHGTAVIAILSEPFAFRGISPRQPPAAAELPRNREVIYFSKADLLPLVSPPKATAPLRRAPAPRPAAPPVRLAFQPAQQILSAPPAPDNRRQTIVQPEVPRLEARAEIRVPNLIRWSAPNLPAPSIPTQIRRAAEPTPPPPLSPRAERTMPSLPTPVAVRAEPPAIPLPAVTGPKLPVPVKISPVARTSPAEPVAEPTPRAAPELPTATAAGGNWNPASVLDLIAVSVAPPPPSDAVIVPPGSRAGAFAVAPDGSGEESSGIPSSGETIASTAGEAGLGGDDRAAIRVPGLSITGGRAAESSAAHGPDPRTELRRLMASVARPSLSRGTGLDRPVEAEFFGSRRVYTVYMNMPNLSSASGSWVLRFAELDEHDSSPNGEGELATPEAIRKVDPMYVASAQRENIQGTVTLAAVVLKDGTLANIRVVGSLDPRLDSSAVAALTQWRFQPARKNGVPVDLEVLVQIPFRTSSL